MKTVYLKNVLSTFGTGFKIYNQTVLEKNNGLYGALIKHF